MSPRARFLDCAEGPECDWGVIQSWSSSSATGQPAHTDCRQGQQVRGGMKGLRGVPAPGQWARQPQLPPEDARRGSPTRVGVTGRRAGVEGGGDSAGRRWGDPRWQVGLPAALPHSGTGTLGLEEAVLSTPAPVS